MDVRPVTLEGRLVRLEPLAQEHAHELWPAADDPDLWRYMTAHVRSTDELEAWVRARVAAGERGTALPLLQRDARSGSAIGSTSIFGIEPEHRTMEVGHTWLGASARGTGHNADSKLLVLTHCFEVLDAHRVQFKTDARNERSQRAIEKLGATREGVLRKQRVLADGHVRDAVVYSIVDDEWPDVRERLRHRLGAAGDA